MTPLLSALAGDDGITALLNDEAQLHAMLAVERVLAEASADAGFIPAADAVAIGETIDAFEPDWDDLHQGMARDGVVVPALVAQLRRRLPEGHRPALHKGATSQDIIDTALMLQIGKVLVQIELRTGEVLMQLSTLESQHGDKSLMAHTRMQAALPTNWRAKIESWLEPLSRHLRSLESMRRELLVVQLGGPVGDRSSFEGHGDAIASGMASRLDLGIATPWHAARDPIVALGNRLALLTGSLGKLGADVTLLAQSEVGAIRLEGGGGSSAMAHKVNPIAAETLVALARYNAGLAGTLQQAMVHEFERSGAAWTLEWLTLPQICESAGASLRLAQQLLGQIRIT